MKFNRDWITAIILMLACLLCFSAGTGILIYKADTAGTIFFGVCTLFLLFTIFIHYMYGAIYIMKSYIPINEYTKNEYENMTVLVRNNIAIAVKGGLREKLNKVKHVTYIQSFNRKKQLLKSVPVI